MKVNHCIEDPTPNKTLIDHGLALFLPSFAVSVVGVLQKEYKDSWWDKIEDLRSKKKGDRRPLQNLDDPLPDSFEDCVGMLQITHCCRIVFHYEANFTNAWGEGHSSLVSLVLDARNMVSHRTAGELDLGAEDAECYVYATLKLARVVNADRRAIDLLERLHEALWRGETIRYMPVRYECKDGEPRVSDVVGLGWESNELRWYDDDDLRDRVCKRMEALDSLDVEREICKRIVSEVETRAFRFPASVCLFPSIPGETWDKAELTFVILPPAEGAVTAECCRPAEAQADQVMATSEGERRRFRNALVFIFPETSQYRALERGTRVYLALRRLGEELVVAELESYIAEADLDVKGRLRAAYSNILVPKSHWHMYGSCYTRMKSRDGNVIDGAVESLVREGLLYLTEEHGAIRPPGVEAVLQERLYRLPRKFATVSEVWSFYSSDLRLPRFESKEVLFNAVWRGVKDGLLVRVIPVNEGSEFLVVSKLELPEVRMETIIASMKAAIELGWVQCGPGDVQRPMEGAEGAFKIGGDSHDRRCTRRIRLGDALSHPLQRCADGGRRDDQAPDGLCNPEHSSKRQKWGRWHLQCC